MAEVVLDGAAELAYNLLVVRSDFSLAAERTF